jgi:uncharacterized membrane protein
LIFYNRLPENVPMHWNVYGQIDSFSPKFPGAFFIPLMEIFMTLVFVFLPKFDPKKENYAKFNKAYTVFMFVMVVFFTAIQLVILGVSMGADFIKVDTIVKLLVGLLILIIGNLMPKLKHNYFMGIKTPWTLSSESVWLKTHRHGGVVWFAAGVLMVLLAFIPGQISAAAYFSITIIAALEPILYSFLCYRKEV